MYSDYPTFYRSPEYHFPNVYFKDSIPRPSERSFWNFLFHAADRREPTKDTERELFKIDPRP